jgi:hypothetical protein
MPPPAYPAGPGAYPAGPGAYAADPGGSADAAPSILPERASVHWRRPVDERSLRRSSLWWTLTTLAHTLPFLLAAPLLFLLKPITTPIGIVLLLHAWAIPELYAARGAGVLRPRRRRPASVERRAMLMLGDLIDDRNRQLFAATGLLAVSSRFGIWVLGEAGALLVRPGGRRVNCYCVRVTGADLPAADRVAHLLLALRCDEAGFATVANLTFSGAAWRVRRRLMAEQRPALDAARALAAELRAPWPAGLRARRRSVQLG